jgi:hypothetical protein
MSEIGTASTGIIGAPVAQEEEDDRHHQQERGENRRELRGWTGDGAVSHAMEHHVVGNPRSISSMRQ